MIGLTFFISMVYQMFIESINVQEIVASTCKMYKIEYNVTNLPTYS